MAGSFFPMTKCTWVLCCAPLEGGVTTWPPDSSQFYFDPDSPLTPILHPEVAHPEGACHRGSDNAPILTELNHRAKSDGLLGKLTLAPFRNSKQAGYRPPRLLRRRWASGAASSSTAFRSRFTRTLAFNAPRFAPYRAHQSLS